MNKEKLVQMVEEMTTDNNGASFLMAKDGHIIVSQKTVDEEHAQFKAAIHESVMSRTAESDSFILDRKGQSYSIAYGQLTRTGTL
ncbi:hypothetical protein QFZ77_000884 [Paenibacillus sp. V4I3]|uniref:hypothetical protein n=1 Tax=unclassified Paenibacillus TaxID=185978 RepID=UPI002782C680|nr:MULTISPECIES: hypothetical protein [unclassified Paenibacillus]MDQ0872225.1 hypothetical protein [Paenibacillus sp. V4I3]MDQ0891893.1 hypothetical protein [Paenibacillus sp. V4I9]